MEKRVDYSFFLFFILFVIKKDIYLYTQTIYRYEKQNKAIL
jgi:hypothetical protein